MVSGLLLLAGCGTPALREKSDQAYSANNQKAATGIQNITKVPSVPLLRKVDTPFIATRSINHDQTAQFPAEVSAVSMQFSGRHGISSIAEIIQRTTNIRVMVHPDVLISPQALVGQSGPASAANTSAQRRTQNPNAEYYLEMPVSYSGPLSDFLDMVATRMGIEWAYVDNRIEFRRFITHTFRIMALPGKTEYSSTLGKQGGIQSGSTGNSATTQNGQFSSTMNVSTQSSVDYWQSIENTIKSMLTSMGKVVINQSTGSVTVTDIRDVIQKVKGLIDDENRSLTRQIAFEVRVLSLRSNDNQELGIDWNIAFQKLRNMMPDWQLTAGNPSSLVGSTAGSIGFQILRYPSSDSDTGGMLHGTSTFLKALAEIGKVTRSTSQTAMTLNRQPVPVAITDQSAYVAETTPGISSTVGAASQPGLKPGMVTTGFMMNLVPTLTERNSMVLTFTIDVSELLEIATFTSGSGATQQSIQLPQVAATQFIQRVGLRSGETLVVTGFERVSNQYKRRTLAPDWPVATGGSMTGGDSREALVIMITPVVVDGV